MKHDGFALFDEDEFELVTPEMTALGRAVLDEYKIEYDEDTVDDMLECLFLDMLDSMNGDEMFDDA